MACGKMFCRCCLVTKSCPTLLQPHGLQPTSLLHPWDFPGKNTGVGHRFFLQGIFSTQGSKLHLLHWQTDSFTTEPPGKPVAKCYQQLNLGCTTLNFSTCLQFFNMTSLLPLDGWMGHLLLKQPSFSHEGDLSEDQAEMLTQVPADIRKQMHFQPLELPFFRSVHYVK